MRFLITFLIIIMIMINNCEAVIRGGGNMNKYVRNMNKAINNRCNKEASIITNNTEIYNCLRVNSTECCRNLENYTEFNNAKMDCIKKCHGDFSSGVFVSIIMWMMLGVWVNHNR